MIRLITIALFVLAAIVLAVWALILSTQKDYLDKRTVRLEEKESLINSHLETLEAEWASLENRKKEILEWEKQVVASRQIKWRGIKKGELIPCRAYIYEFAYNRQNNFGGKITIDGFMMPNEKGVTWGGEDTWYLPADDIKNLPKE